MQRSLNFTLVNLFQMLVLFLTTWCEGVSVTDRTPRPGAGANVRAISNFCRDEQAAQCITMDIDGTTENSCLQAENIFGYRCTCDNVKYKEVVEEGIVMKCIPMEAGECSSEQAGACMVEHDTGNSCYLPDIQDPNIYQCSCLPPKFVPEVDKDSRVVIRCVPARECFNTVQMEHCVVLHFGVETGNRCYLRVNGESYECVCNTTTYKRSENGESCIPVKEDCDVRQSAACLLLQHGKQTKNQCLLPDPEDIDKHECVCTEEGHKSITDNWIIVRCRDTKLRMGECKDTQKFACEVSINGTTTGNKCEVPDKTSPDDFICICKDIYDTAINDLGFGINCKKGGHCKEEGKIACAISTPEEQTQNKCKVPNYNRYDEYECKCEKKLYEELLNEQLKVIGCKTKLCKPADLEACKVNDTANQCEVTKEGYICKCLDHMYEKTEDTNAIVIGCSLKGEGCKDYQSKLCKVRSPTGKETENKCVVPDKLKRDQHVCICGGGYEEVLGEEGVAIKCEITGGCSPAQKEACKDGVHTKNFCRRPNKNLIHEYECECKPPYEPQMDSRQKIIGCKSNLTACTVEQDSYCMVVGADSAEPTLNKCGQPDIEDNSTYVCDCKDPSYISIFNLKGMAVNCSRKACDAKQEAACQVEVDGQQTKNRCFLPVPLQPEKYDCICNMPYFISTDYDSSPICDLLPEGTFYMQKPTNVTVTEGSSVIIDCVLDRALNMCSWRRAEHTILPSSYANKTFGSTSYILQGDACDGICSVKISAATLMFDNAWWTCIPHLEGTDILPARGFVHVVVPPNNTWLEYGGKILENDASVYVSLGLSSARIQVKCVSRSAYPSVKHIWSQDGEYVVPNPRWALSKDDNSQTFSTSSVTFFVVRRGSTTTITCYALNDVGVRQSASMIALPTARTTEVKIFYLLDGEWFEPDFGIIVLEYPTETLLQCVADGRPEPHYQWEEEIKDEWQPVGFQESYIITTHTRKLRCLAGNALNNMLVESKPVTIESKGSGDLPGPGTGPPHLDTVYYFLQEPNDQIIGPGATFDLGCEVNGPVHTCLWTRWDKTKNDLGSLPSFSFTKHKSEGYCSIQIENAEADSLGGWVCQPVLYDGHVMLSREGVVSGLHFNLYPDGFEKARPFKPVLVINGKETSPGKLVVLNLGEVEKAWVEVSAICSAYAQTDHGTIEWKLEGDEYRKHESERTNVHANSSLYLIKSKVNFIFSASKSEFNAPKPLLMDLGCRVVERTRVAFSASEWTFLHLDETVAVLTLEHPVSNVDVIPPGIIELSDDVPMVELICTSNGFPPPSIQWQELNSEENRWMDIPNAYHADLKVSKEGTFRCTAGNEHNENGRVSSRVVYVQEADALVEESSSQVRCTMSSFFWTVATTLLFILVHCVCF